jgi:hypothetical protein
MLLAALRDDIQAYIPQLDTLCRVNDHKIADAAKAALLKLANLRK